MKHNGGLLFREISKNEYEFKTKIDKNQVDMFSSLPDADTLIKVPSLMDISDWEEREALEKEKEIFSPPFIHEI